MKAKSKAGASSNGIGFGNKLAPKYTTLGIDPSFECIGIGAVSNKWEMEFFGHVNRPKGTSKQTWTEAFETMCRAFKEDFSTIPREQLVDVRAISIEYPFIGIGRRANPQSTIKLALLAGAIYSIVREQFNILGKQPVIVFTSYSEVKEYLGVQRWVLRASGKNNVAQIIGRIYGFFGELEECGGSDGGYRSKIRPDVINQDTIDALAHAHYCLGKVSVGEVAMH